MYPPVRPLYTTLATGEHYKMCSCRKRIDAVLRPKNARLAFGFCFNDNVMSVSPALIMLEKREKKRGALPTLLATFCPFCGEAYKKGTTDGV